MKVTGMPAIADDSGLMVEALGGAPGVYSAGICRRTCSPTRKNNEKIDVADGGNSRRQKAGEIRIGDHADVLDGRILTARGECPGTIGRVPEGTNGFGYDPLSFRKDIPSPTRSDSGGKNRISHRAKALEILRRRLESEE